MPVPADIPVPNELVSLEQEIGELEGYGLKLKTPTGLSRLVNEIRAAVASRDNGFLPSLIHPRDEPVGVLFRANITSNQLILGPNGTSPLGTGGTRG